MKKLILVFLLSPLLFSFNLMAQNTGIGTTIPENTLHVFKGSAGSVTGWSQAPLIVEGSTDNYINILAPDAAATGILFGKPANNICGGILYNSLSSNNPNGFDFRTNGNNTRMVLTSPGNLGVGTSTPENILHVFKGSAGSVTGYSGAPLIVENSSSSYVNILAPDANETGILFGKPANTVSGGIIYNSSGTLNGLQFRTNGNITKMVLTDVGSLGVGTTAPGGYKLKVSHGSSGFDIENATTLDDWEFLSDIESDLSLLFNGVPLGYFSGFSGAYFYLSDEHLKTNIRPMSQMLEKIRQLEPSTYQFKNTQDKQECNGFIAQDVMKIFPGLVMHNINPERNIDVYTMDYSGFGVIAIKGIQELESIIEEQKEKIAELEARLVKTELRDTIIVNLTQRIEKLEILINEKK